MKALELAAEFSRVFTALDPLGFPENICRTEQSDESYLATAFVFETTTTALDGRGRALAYVLTVLIQSHSQDNTASAHAARVSAVQRLLFGTAASDLATAKAALTAAFATGGNFTLRNYDAANEENPTLDSSRFSTPIVVRGIALVTADI